MPDIVTTRNLNLTESPASDPENGAAKTPFFAVSLTKLAVMSVCTVGLYEFYWFYRNWRLIKEREGSTILPFWRAFFGFFFCYQCFDRVRSHAEDVELPTSLSAGWMTATWIMLTLSWKLHDPYSLLSFLAFVPLLPVQSLANRVNSIEVPTHNRNSRLTGWNIAVVVLGGLLVILNVVSVFCPLEEETADVSHPKTLVRQNFTLQYPANWKVNTGAEDYDPDHQFVIADGHGQSFVMFVIGAGELEADKRLGMYVQEFEKLLGSPRIEGFERYGSLTGKGAILKGRRMVLLRETIKLFAFHGDSQSVTIVQSCSDDDLSRAQDGFDLIQNSFSLTTSK